MTRSPWFTASVAALFVVLAIVNSSFSAAFPDGSPAETLYNLGISVDLIAIAAVLGAVSVLRWRRARAGVAPRPASTVILRDGRVEETPTARLAQIPAVIGAAMSAAAIIAWTLFSGTPIITAVMLDEPQRYLTNVGAAFWFGVPWVLGVVLSTIGFRVDRSGRHRTVSMVGLGLGLLLVVPVLISAGLYASGASS